MFQRFAIYLLALCVPLLTTSAAGAQEGSGWLSADPTLRYVQIGSAIVLVVGIAVLVFLKVGKKHGRDASVN